MSKGSGSTRATNSKSAHGGGNMNSAYNREQLLKGVPQQNHERMIIAADKVAKMTNSEKASIKPNISTAFEYEAALRMNPERLKVASLLESKGALIHGDGSRTGLTNGVYQVKGVNFYLNGNEVRIGVNVSGGNYKKIRGRIVPEPTKISDGMSTISIYDTEKMKKLIQVLKE